MKKINEKAFFKLVDHGYTQHEIMRELGISRATYYNYRKKYTTFVGKLKPKRIKKGSRLNHQLAEAFRDIAKRLQAHADEIDAARYE